jgi:dTDP-glucose 4,6-dehydratase
VGGRHAFVTGAAGFIGSNLVERILETTDWTVTAYDALTYAGNRASLSSAEATGRCQFVHANICDKTTLRSCLIRQTPDLIFHLAAESHVDRSIDSADDFITTNVSGTQTLLDCAREVHQSRPDLRLIHISTDEVFGDLAPEDAPFDEKSPYLPSSPYAASKAGSDHLVRAAYRTHGLPTIISNCSNNYGPRQFPEKLIPLMILNLVRGLPLPIYGDGSNRRDWLHVQDHADALISMARYGVVGETYCVGGGAELSNLEVVTAIHTYLHSVWPQKVAPLSSVLHYVTDRPGHDRRYAINSSKIRATLGWTPQLDFGSGLASTIDWYLSHEDWWQAVLSGAYRGQRLGLGLDQGSGQSQ